MCKNFTRMLLLCLCIAANICFVSPVIGQQSGTLPSTPGTALSFDGVDDHVSLHPSVANLAAFTIEAWIKPTANSGTIYSEGLSSSNSHLLSLTHSQNGNNGFAIDLKNASGVGLSVNTTNGSAPLNQWSHIAFVRTSATTAQLLINGIVTDDFTFADPGSIHTDTASFGVRQGAIGENFFSGSMDEARIWSRALSQAEIRNNKDCELNAAGQNGLLSLYHFNQGIAGGVNFNRKWILAIQNDEFGTYIDPITGYGVEADGSELDLYTYTTVLPVPNPYIPVVFMNLDDAFITYNPDTELWTTLRFTTVNIQSRDEITFENVPVRTVFGSIYNITTKGELVSIDDDQTILDPVSFSVISNGKPWSVLPTPPLFRTPFSPVSFGISGGAFGTFETPTLTDETGRNNGTLHRFLLVDTVSNWSTGNAVGSCAVFTPATEVITGNPSVCINGTTTLSNPVSGGIWSSANTAVATVDTSGVVSGLTAGTSMITYTNLSGGVSTFTVTVNAAPTARITAGSATAFCPGGQVVLTATAGTSYLWSNHETTQSITVNSAGNYSVTVTNADNCSATSTATAVTVNPVTTPVITADGPTNFCMGGSVTLTASAGSAYLWSNNATSQSITVNASGNYSVTVMNANGCSATSSVTAVSVAKIPSVFAMSGGGSYCEGSGGVMVGLNGSETGVNYQLYNGASPVGNLLAGNGSAISFGKQAVAGTYTVKATDASSSSCTSNMSGNAVIIVNPVPTVNTVSNQTVCANLPVNAISFSGAVAGTKYAWTTNNGSIGLATSGTGNINSFIAQNTTNAPVTATVTVTPTAGGESLVYASGSGSTYVINSNTNTVVKTIPNNLQSEGAVLSPDGSMLYITHSIANTVVVYNTATSALVATIPVGNYPYGIAISSDGSRVYVTNNSANTISVISTADNTVINTVAAPGFAFNTGLVGITVTPDGSKVYAANQNGNGVTVVNTVTNVASRINFSDGAATGIIAHPDGSKVYVSGYGSIVHAVNTTTNAVTSINIGRPSWGLGISPDGKILYAADNYSDKVTVISTLTNTVVATVTVGSSPMGISVTPDGKYVYVSNAGDNSVSVIDAVTNSVITTINGTNNVRSIGQFISPAAAVCVGMPITFSITVNPLPTATITAGGPLTFCAGGSVTLTASAGSSYLWSNGATTQSITVNTGGLYNVKVTNAQGCTATSANTIVTVNASPLVAAITGVTNVCIGTTTQLSNTTANGVWSSADGTIAAINTNGLVTSQAPGSATVSYTVTGANSCATSVNTSVTVNALPLLSVSASPAAICNGESATLTASGAQTYLWQPGSLSGSSVTVSPSATTTYTLTGVDANGCSSVSGAGWKSVSSGGIATLALKSNGTLWATGNNFYGQIGDGSNTSLTTFQQIGNTTWTAISVGNNYVLGIKSDGTLWAWGSNNDGQLGIGTNTPTNIPVQIGNEKWKAIAAGMVHSLAIKSDGTLWAWGANTYGQLGNGTTVSTNTPIQIGTATWLKISTGSDVMSVAIRSDGTLWSWGSNHLYQLGIGVNTPIVSSPTQVGVANTWASIASGQSFTLGIRTDGTLWTWGYAYEGALGQGATNPSPNPVQIGNATWSKVAAGYRTSMAIKSDGTLWTWGYNSGSTLGNGNTTNTRTPGQIGTALWKDISTTGMTSFGIQADETIWAWASNNNGQYGNGTYASATVPVQTGNTGVKITVNAVPNVAPITGTLAVCAGSTTQLSNVTAGGVWTTSNASVAFVNFAGLVSGVSAGTSVITYTVTNASNCKTSVTATVTVNALPSFTVTKTDVGCPGGSDGSITVAALTGQAPYEYSIDGGLNYQAGNGFAGLSAGVYTVVIKSATNCLSVSQQVIIGTVADIIKPVPNMANLPVLRGECSVTVSDAPTATDNCVGTVTGTTNDPLSYSVQGTYTITWLYNDGHGNIETQTQLVVVKDITAPVAVITALPIITGECLVRVAAPTATDNCSGMITGTTSDPLTYSVQGTYVVTWTYNDGHGNLSSQTQTVIVHDITAPVITSPATVAVNNDPGKCGATITINNPIATDNCSIVSVVGTRDDEQLLTADYPVGTTMINWTFTDIVGNTSSATQQVFVTDNEVPVVVTQPVTVSLNAAGEASVTKEQINNRSSDNCGISLVTLDKTNFSCANVGENIVTLTVTDIHGNSSSRTATVTVVDHVAPTVITQNITVALNASGAATINTAQINNGSTDNCSIASYSLDNTSFSCANVGANTVTLTVTDVNGNSASKTAIVTVVDNIAPILTAVANQTFCANANGSNAYTIPVLQATDNCRIVSVKYEITGATTRSANGLATGLNASGSYNIGTSIIKWTVTDANGNSSVSTTTVIINPLPVSNITAASADAFCNRFVLTGGSTLTGPFSYQWLYNNQSQVGSSQQLSLNLTNSDGVYSLYTTDANGCKSATAATYQYQKQNLVSSYTILTFKDAEIGKYNKVNSGSVGVMSSKGEAEFKSYSSVSGPGSFVKAPKIDKDGTGINISNQVIGMASVSLPVMQYNSASTKYLPNYNATYNNAVLTANYNNLTVKKGISITVTGNTFGTVKLEKGASIRFTNPLLNIDNLDIDQGANDDDYTYIYFAPNTSVRVSSKVSVGSQVRLNPENSKVTFYMGDLKNDEEKFTVKGEDTRVIANIYMPDGKLRVTATDEDDGHHDTCDHKAHSAKDCKHKGHNHKDCDHKAHNPADCNDDVYMTGLYIVEELESKGNIVIWNSFDCSAPATTTANTVVTKQTAVTATSEANATEDDLKVTVMPNPSTTFFTLKIESKYAAPVNMRVIDASGRVVDAKSKITPNSSVQIGHNYSSGTYYAELIQGTSRKVIQLIKGRG